MTCSMPKISSHLEVKNLKANLLWTLRSDKERSDDLDKKKYMLFSRPKDNLTSYNQNCCSYRKGIQL